MMAIGDHEGQIFYPTLTQIMDSFFFFAHHQISHFILENIKRLPENPEYA